MSSSDYTSSQQLIPVSESTIGGTLVPTVDARALHAFLEVQSHFRDWIKNRIAEYDFRYDVDFRYFFSETPEGGRPAKEYSITIDMAKELAMVERNAKGKEARQYFIECERMAKATVSQLSPAEFLVQQANLLLEQERRTAALEVEQKRLAAEQAATTARLNQIETATDHFTVVGYLRYEHGKSCDLPTAARLGRECTIYCKKHAVPLGTVPDPRFGIVNTYPKWVLDHVIGDGASTKMQEPERAQ